VNTPQFSWVLSRLPKKAQPVPPFYQPEVAARAIVFAARHPRREIYVGMPSVLTILANKVAPGMLDRLLARRAYDQQFTAQRIAPDRPFNMFHPVASPYRAHGSFEQRAHRASPQLWTSLHRGLAGAMLATGGLALLAWKLRRARTGATDRP
jgi:hypothetical protein